MSVSSPTTSSVRTVVVGAGPQALSLVLHLLEADPGARDGLVVLDPSGGWMCEWADRFARFRIDQLRSPGVHHPAPDAGALATWLKAEGRPAAGPYGIPRTEDFAAFCAHLVGQAGIEDLVDAERAHLVCGAGERPVVLAGPDRAYEAERVVIACDPHRHRLPPWLGDLLPRPRHQVEHAGNLDLRAVDVEGEDVAIVGGGLTGVHLALGALANGAATVRLVSRRPLRQQMFDTDPGWLGPKCLRGFNEVSDWERRHERVLAARDGGSIPPWMWRRIGQAALGGRLELHEDVRVVAAGDADGRIALVLGDERRLEADRLWLATGTAPDVGAGNLFEDLRRTHPTAVVGGFPALDEDLSWPGTKVHLMGRLTSLVLGPAAGNLWGARVGARRIVPTVLADGRPPVSRRADPPAAGLRTAAVSERGV